MNKPTFGTYRGWSDKWEYGVMHHGKPNFKIAKAFIQDLFGHPLLDNIVEVDPKSLAMFTGLYDKEGTPIYGSIPLPDGTMSRGGDIIRIHPMVFLNTHHPIWITDEHQHVEAVIFYDNSLGEFAFEAYHFVFPVSFVLNQRHRYPLNIFGNAHETPEFKLKG